MSSRSYASREHKHNMRKANRKVIRDLKRYHASRRYNTFLHEPDDSLADPPAMEE